MGTCVKCGQQLLRAGKCEACGARQPQSRGVLVVGGLVVTALLAVAAATVVWLANRVSVKQNTPQAAIATLVKIYQHRAWKLLPQVVEPTVARTEARDDRCSGKQLLDLMCKNAEMDCIMKEVKHDYSPCDKPKYCPVHLKRCRCGSPVFAKPFIDTSVHKGLRLGQLQPDRCTIEDAHDISTKKELTRLLGDQPDETLCGDYSPNDKLAVVTLRCEGDDPLQFILRDREGWRVYALSLKTLSSINVSNSVEQYEKQKKKRREELNKDMK